VFLMQGSSGENINQPLKKTLLLSFLLGMIGIILFVFWGDKLLLAFKKEFSRDSFTILKVLFCSIFFFIINQIYITVLNIRKAVGGVVAVSGIIVGSMIVFSVFFLPKMKSEGVAYAWLISNFIGNMYILAAFFKKTVGMSAVLPAG